MFGQAFNSGFFTGPNYIYKEDIFGDSSCIGLYTMDYDFSDSSGNDNDMGVFGSPDHGVSGGLNLGARFDGYNTSARAYPVSDLQGLTSVSISFWFKWDDSASVSNYGHMVNIGDMGGLGNGDAFGIAVGNDGASYNRVLYGFFPEGSLSTGQTVTDNVWHHVLMTYSGTTIKYYYDGNSTPIATQTRTSLSLPNSAVNRISVGHYAYNGNHHFKGDLDHLRVFNREIQSSELATLYNEKFYSPKATTTDVNYPATNTAYYKLDNSAADETGSYNGTETNIEYRFGQFGQAAVFNGSSAITTSLNIGRANDYTISFWIKDITDSNYGTYADKWIMGVYNNDYLLFTYNKTSGKILHFVHDGTTLLGTLQTPVLDDNWHHIVCTQDVNVETKLYVDGVLQTSETVSHTSMTQRRSVAGGTGFYFGQNPSNSSTDLRLKGKIDQVRIFSTALNSTQVARLYNEKPETDTSTFKTVLWNMDGVDGRYISNVGFEPNFVWIKDRDDTSSHVIFDSVRGATNYLTSSSTAAEASASTTLQSFEANGFTLGNSGTTNDSTGNGAVAWCWKAGGLLNKSASFNGSNSYIYANNSVQQPTTNFSVSVWSKWNSKPSGPVGLVGNFKTGVTPQVGFAIAKSSGENVFSFFADGTASSSAGKALGTTNFVTGQWYHTVGTYDGSNVKIYVNGVLEGTTAYTATPGATDQPLVIGRWYGNYSGYYHDGQIDQVRIFNKAISASEVTSLYNETSSTINTLQVLGDTSCVATYPLGTGAGDIGNTYSGTPSNVTFNNPGHLTRNTNGTIESAVSANTSAGFSIVKWTGNDLASQTIGHGLSSTPEITIIKKLTAALDWQINLNSSITGTEGYFNFNTAALYTTFPNYYTSANSTVLSTNGTTTTERQYNNQSADYIAYCFHSVSGYSKIGLYSGSGAAGNIITGLGFRPNWLMVKRLNVSGNSWLIVDSKRVESSGNLSELFANTTTAETTGYDIDFTADGFTLNTTTTNANASGTNNYLYMAFK